MIGVQSKICHSKLHSNFSLMWERQRILLKNLITRCILNNFLFFFIFPELMALGTGTFSENICGHSGDTVMSYVLACILKFSKGHRPGHFQLSNTTLIKNTKQSTRWLDSSTALDKCEAFQHIELFASLLLVHLLTASMSILQIASFVVWCNDVAFWNVKICSSVHSCEIKLSNNCWQACLKYYYLCILELNFTDLKLFCNDSSKFRTTIKNQYFLDLLAWQYLCIVLSIIDICFAAFYWTKIKCNI